MATRVELLSSLSRINLRATIKPEIKADAATVALVQRDADLVAVDERGLTALAPRLVLGATIGEGGMAIVRVATQTSLGREVAVKSARPDAPGPAAASLLREAWITGSLEHPNIVPIHDLGTDDAGRPMLVLKRIEGRPWSALLGKPAEIRAEFGADALEWNLQQLIRVCHAVSFAHARGIVHRDLKPANVMIGRFGEVYLVDWGIAVSLVDDGSGRLPLAAQARELAGTPAYMAPEMLGDAPLTERTDVYLLGAIAFEIATGAPPHAGETTEDTLSRIALSEPAFPPDAPRELAAICRRAMARDPADRFATAEALRVALVGFLEHRGSAALARDAATQLAELETALRAPDVERALAYQQLGRCRFGFEAALRAWPDNALARAGLDGALAAVASYELDHGDARAASVLLGELREPPPALVARLAELERAAGEEARRREELERLGADHDVAIGSVARTVFIVLLAIAWCAIPMVASVLPPIDVDHPTGLVVSGLSLSAIAGYAWFARRAMTATALNRGVVATAFVAILLHAAVEAVAWGLGVDMVATRLIAIGAWIGVGGTAAIFIDRALAVPTLGLIAALAAAIEWPAQQLWAMSAGCLVLMTTIVYVLHRATRGRPIAGLADLLRLTRA